MAQRNKTRAQIQNTSKKKKRNKPEISFNEFYSGQNVSGIIQEKISLAKASKCLPPMLL